MREQFYADYFTKLITTANGSILEYLGSSYNCREFRTALYICIAGAREPLLATFFPLTYLITGLILGLTQGLLLSRVDSGLSIFTWTAATATGWLLTWILRFLIHSLLGGLPLTEIFEMLFLGLVTGVCQWWVLRKLAANAELWILVCIASWGAAYITTFALTASSTTFFDPAYTFVRGLSDGWVIGVLTALGIIRLIKPLAGDQTKSQLSIEDDVYDKDETQ